MSRYRATCTVEKSEPFAGLSIGKQLRDSAYGKFEDAMKQIAAGLQPSFNRKLPRVILVGERSVGKSSLLEFFTKRSVFPKGTGTCTKMPIRLQIKAVTAKSMPKHVATVRYTDQQDIHLTSTDDVLAAVQSIIDRAQGITADEITVEITQVDGAMFTYVDLPGTQQWPQHKASKALVASYLNDTSQDTLVLCVIDATNAADLENSAAVKEIAAAGKMSNTILVLTKCDEVQDVDAIPTKVFDPLEKYNGNKCQAPSADPILCCCPDEGFFASLPHWKHDLVVHMVHKHKLADKH